MLENAGVAFIPADDKKGPGPTTESQGEREGGQEQAFVLDTNVAIHLRDGDPLVTQKVAALEGAVLISVVTRVELEGGYREPAHAAIRRARLDAMLSAIPALAFDDLAAKTYGDIVASAGCSRRKPLDRMIAAQALVHRATLVTFNQEDFSNVPGLLLLVWPSR
jgi:predicted nucleic acid-binding protein